MNLPELSISDVQAACARGEWTSAALVEHYLLRIAEESTVPAHRCAR